MIIKMYVYINKVIVIGRLFDEDVCGIVFNVWKKRL